MLGAGAERLVPGANTWIVRLPAGRRIATLASLPGVLAVEPDRVRTRRGGPDPLIAKQGHLRQIGWSLPTGRRRPLVAVLDTGADGRSPDLDGQIVSALARSFVDDAPLRDRSGHGTHVAGIVAAEAGNGAGGAGVANARLLIIKIADAQGRATTSTLVRGLRYAVERGAKIVNVSFGGDGFSKLEQDAILKARQAGVLIVVAVGNTGGAGSAREYPGAYRHVLAVAATRPDGAAILDSTRGPQVAIAAPGKRILSTLPGRRYGFRTGTSMASAVVSGAAARLLAARPGLDASQLRTLLIDGAVDSGDPGFDPATGWGQLNLGAALAAPTPDRDGAEPNDDAAQARTTQPLLPGSGQAEASVTARFERWADPKDCYRVTLAVGESLSVTATGPAGADPDLVIWRPNAPAFVPGGAYSARWLAATSVRPGATETLTFTATEPGDHTVEVTAAAGRGRYALSVGRSPAPPALPPAT